MHYVASLHAMYRLLKPGGLGDNVNVSKKEELATARKVGFCTCLVRLFRRPSVTILRGGALGRAEAESSSMTLQKQTLHEGGIQRTQKTLSHGVQARLKSSAHRAHTCPYLRCLQRFLGYRLPPRRHCFRRCRRRHQTQPYQRTWRYCPMQLASIG